MTRIKSKFQRMVEMRSLYLLHPEGLTDEDLAERFGVNRSSIVRLRQELGNVIKVSHGRYTIEPTPEDVTLARVILTAARSRRPVRKQALV